MQTAYFAQQTGANHLSIYIPPAPKVVLYCDSTVVTIDLDRDYLRYPESARAHADEILASFDVRYEYYEPTTFTAGVLPEIPDDWAVMSCPRAIGEKSGRIGVGHLGPKLRKMLVHARCPLLIPAGLFKPWKRITVLFGGPGHGEIALQVANTLAARANLPLSIFTQLDECTEEECERIFVESGVDARIQEDSSVWQRYPKGDLQENLYNISHDALVVVGTGKHSLVKEVLFGSTLEQIQTMLPQPLLVCGTNCRMTPIF